MIRKAKVEDIPTLVEMVSRNLDSLLPRSTQEYMELIDTTFVAEVDGSIAGSCVLEIYSPKICEVRTVVVDDKFRKRGIGRALVEAAVAEANTHHIREIMVVTDNPKFFEGLNFGICLNNKYAMFLQGD